MSSNYTRYNLTRAAYFLDHRFLINLIIKKTTLNGNYFTHLSPN